MARIAEPYIVIKRGQSFQFTLNSTCGLPQRICAEWQRRSFRTLPDELMNYRIPKTKSEAKANIQVLIAFLKKKQVEGSARRVMTDDITVGAWIEKFTAIETSPRTGVNASRNRPYSIDTIQTYRCYWDTHIKGDPFMTLKMAETEEEDATEYITRLAVKKLADGRPCGGTRTFAGVVRFIRMAFKEYQRKNKRWFNPFMGMEVPVYHKKNRDALPEDEMIRLFGPGALKSAMELAVCAAMFLSGLRRSEIFALKPEDLDWHTPKITVRRAWQSFDRKEKVLGPPKGKRERDAPFDPVLQEAVKKLWAENGKHDFVFCRKDGSTPESSWIYANFPRWLKGILCPREYS